MLTFPVVSVILVFLMAYVPVPIRALLISRRSTGTTFGKLNSRAAGRTAVDFREGMDENSYNMAGRLQASHENQLETLGIYAAGIAASLATPVKQAAIHTFAGLYLAARVLYNIVYAMPPIANGIFRSLLFLICVICKLHVVLGPELL
jgi:uncharacterized MAPEG superfamily protein